MREWRKSLKRIFVLALSVMLIGNSVDLSGVPVFASASQVQESVSNGDAATVEGTGEVSAGDVLPVQSSDLLLAEEELVGTVVSSVELPGNDELFAGYVDKMFYGGFSFFGESAGAQLASNGAQDLYQELKEEIVKVANGELASTVFTPSASLTYSNVSLDGAKAAFKEDIAIIMDALLHDCPYELYWYDKTVGCTYSYSYSYGDSTDGGAIYSYVAVELAQISFYVTGTYQADSSNLKVDTTKTGATSTAVAKAKAIVTENAGLGDYDKLVAYKTKICELVTYDHAAISSGSYTTDNSPWQLIHVFDGDTTTNVVCEGYSKAFQYLCDMSDFTDASCYTVTGQMAGGTGAGGHMWNIVTMDDGKNYLVDVTNSDSGTIGQNGGLFLAGSSEEASKTYSVSYSDGSTGTITYAGYNFNVNGTTVFFGYDKDIETLWGTGDSSILKIAATDYTYEAPCEHTAVGGTVATCTSKAVCGNCGESFGSVDTSNHAGTEFTYAVNATDATKHDKNYKCCGALAATETHTYNAEGACELCAAGESITSVSLSVTAPEGGAAPQNSIAAGTGYTGAISWKDAGDADWDYATENYGFNTAYTVTITLTATGSYQFAYGIQYEGYQASVSADGRTLTLTKTFDATRKEKLTDVTALTPVVLDAYCATAADAIAQLPTKVSYTTETGTVEAQITWSDSVNYVATPGAENTFTWTVSDAAFSQKYGQNSISVTGTLKVTNAAAVSVTNGGTDKQITYDGSTYDVSALFSIDANAGAASYELISGASDAEGEGTLSGSTLTITKAGTFTVKLTTAAVGAYAEGSAQAVLTVEKGEGTGVVTVENWAYQEDGNIAVNSTTNPGTATIRYTGTSNRGTSYSSGSAPVDAGYYTVTVVLPANDLYQQLTLTDTFIIEKASPQLGTVSATGTLYESTLASEVVLTAENTFVAGELVLDGVTELVVGTQEYGYKFTPEDTYNYKEVTGKVSLTVLENALQKIELVTLPTKSAYTYGEGFELTGAVVQATYADGTVKDVTAYVSYDADLVAGQTEVVLSYQGKTCSVSGITVAKKQLDVTNLTWTESTFEYDGEEKAVLLAGDLPDGVVITYSGNVATDAGQYTAKAVVEFADESSSANYELVGADAYTSFSWSINPKELNNSNVTYELGDSLTYNGKAQTQGLKSVKCDGLEVTYEVTSNTGATAGDYTLTVNGTDNFSGSYDIPWSIAKKDISGAQIVLGDELVYNAASQTKDVQSISVDELTLASGDYTITGDSATDAGDYTITVSGQGNFTGSASIAWSIAKKDISQVQLTLGADKTYNGAVQTMEITVGTVDGMTATYDITGNTATNAGDYEVVVTGNGNFTGSVKKTWSIAQKSIATAQVVLGSALTYNGAEQSQTVSSVTVDGMTLSTSDYTLSGNIVVNAGDYTLTITGKGNFAGTVTKDFTIAKAPAPSISTVEKYYVYSVGSGGAAVSVDLAGLLPENVGTVTYQLAANDAAYVTDAAVDASGKLTYKVGATGTIGDSTTLTVTVVVGNYEDIVLKVTINITDKYVTVQKAGAEVALADSAEAVYGQKLGELALNTDKAVFVVDGTNTVVAGTLAWGAPDTLLSAGANVVQWKFTPQDTDNYTEVMGTLTVQAKKATPVVTIPATEVTTYHPANTLADLALVGAKGSYVVDGAKAEVDGTWSWKDKSLVPTVNNSGYVAVFTPVDTANYNSVEITVAVKVSKATPYVETKPSAKGIVYGDTLAAAALTGGKAVHAEGSTWTVEGTFAWVDTSVAPSVADSGITEYGVMFTPSDADNYTSVKVAMTVVVDKAEKAPDMPAEEMKVKHSKKVVQDVELPEGWSWLPQDADKELITGEAVEATAVYVGADGANYEVTTVTVAITRDKKKEESQSGKPAIVGEDGKNGWDMIRDEVTEVKEGEAVIVAMNGAVTVPKSVFEAAKGKDVTLVFRMENGLSWTINGKSITAAQPYDINFGVKAGTDNIPKHVIERVAGKNDYVNISLDYSGEFGLTAILNIDVKAENAGRYANLFYYNEKYGYMQFVGADEINEQGIAHLAFTHASEYTVVIADTILDTAYTSPKTGDTSWFMIMILVFVVLTGCTVIRRKREM